MAKRPHDDTPVDKDIREVLLDAAWRTALHSSETGKRVKESQVLMDAGCTRKQLRSKFGDFETLMRTAMERALARWSADMEAQVNQKAPAADRVRERSLALVSWGVSHAASYRMLFITLPGLDSGPHHYEDSEAYLRLRQDVAEVAGVPDDDSALDELMFIHWATLHGLTASAIARPDLGRRKVKRAVRTVLDRFIAQLESVSSVPEPVPAAD